MDRESATPLIPLVSDAVDDVELQAMFARIRPLYAGELLDYHRLLGNNPEVLRKSHDLALALLTPTGDLTAGERLCVGLVVSRFTRCPYMEQMLDYFLARFSHLPGALTPDQVMAIRTDLESAELPPRIKAVARFAQRLAQNPGAITAEHWERLRDVGLTDRSILDLVAMAAYYQYMRVIVQAGGLTPELDPERIAGMAERGRQEFPGAGS